MPDIQCTVRGLLGTECEQGSVHKSSGRLAGPIVGHGTKDSLHLLWRQSHRGGSLQEGREDVAVHLHRVAVHVCQDLKRGNM